MSQRIAISCYRKDFILPHLALTSKSNARVTVHVVRLNILGKEKEEKKNWPVMCTYVVFKSSCSSYRSKPWRAIFEGEVRVFKPRG